MNFLTRFKLLWRGYSASNFPSKGSYTKYEIDDFADATIVDITADQFPDFEIPVFVGSMGCSSIVLSFVMHIS